MSLLRRDLINAIQRAVVQIGDALDVVLDLTDHILDLGDFAKERVHVTRASWLLRHFVRLSSAICRGTVRRTTTAITALLRVLLLLLGLSIPLLTTGWLSVRSLVVLLLLTVAHLWLRKGLLWLLLLLLGLTIALLSGLTIASGLTLLLLGKVGWVVPTGSLLLGWVGMLPVAIVALASVSTVSTSSTSASLLGLSMQEKGVVSKVSEAVRRT